MTVEDRIEEIKVRESMMLNCAAINETEDVTGWTASLEILIDKWMRQAQQEKESGDLSDRSSGVLLTGPNGCGKHTALFSIVRMLEDRGFGFAFLDGYDLPDLGETNELINALFDTFYDENKALCIVLENTENYRERARLFKLIEKNVLAYWFNQNDRPPLFTVIIGDDIGIPRLLRDRLYACQFNLPDEEARSRYIENAAKELEHYVSFKSLTALTEGLTFTQIGRIIACIANHIDRSGGVDEVMIRSMIRPLLPPTDNTELVGKLVETLERIAGQIPEIINASTNVRTPSYSNSAYNQDIDNDDLYLEEQKKTQNMKVKDLAFELWGERAAMLQQR